MSPERPPADHDPRHTKAVANSLRLATDAAERGDYTEALAWVDTVRAIGDELPVELQVRRSSWLRELSEGDGDGYKSSASRETGRENRAAG